MIEESFLEVEGMEERTTWAWYSGPIRECRSRTFATPTWTYADPRFADEI